VAHSTGQHGEKHRDGVNVSDPYPPTPGSGNNSTDDLYASLLGDIGLAGRVPSSVPVVPAGQAPVEAPHDESLPEARDEADLLPDEVGTDDDLGGADYPLAPEVSRSSFVAPTTDDARAYAASRESGDPFETIPVVFDPSSAVQESASGNVTEQPPAGPPTGAFTSPAAQNAQPAPLLGSNGRRRPTFDEVLYGTAPGY